MAVTDLTNTKWLFNNEPSLADDEWHINFTSNNQTFDTINPTDASEIMWYSYNNYSVMIDAYNENSTPRWQNEAYKTIEITGGTDATNANLISWLESNATQVIETTTDIVIGSNTLTGVDTIKLTDASDDSNKIDFTYGVTPSGTVNVKLGENTLVGVNEISVRGTDNTFKSFGYVPTSFSVSGIRNDLLLTYPCADYSLDGGITWISFSTLPNTYTINNVTQFKVRCWDYTNSDDYSWITYNSQTVCNGIGYTSSNPNVYDFGTLNSNLTNVNVSFHLD